MRRIYLSPAGQAKLPQPGENSHYGMARTELGQDWRGSADDAYAEMWNRGWVRVVDYGDKVYAERYADGRPVKLADLTHAQCAWLKDQVLAGKELIWNDQVFSLTTESQSGQASELVAQLIGKR